MLSKDHKKLLKRLKLDHLKKTAPGFFEASGSYAMAVKPYSDDTANGLTRCIEDFINHLRGYCNRVSTTGTMRKIGGQMKWTKGNSNTGAPDLRFIYQGRSGDVEVKIGRDKLSKAQQRELQKIKDAGGLAFVAKDFASFIDWWEEIGFEVPVFDNVTQNEIA